MPSFISFSSYERVYLESHRGSRSEPAGLPGFRKQDREAKGPWCLGEGKAKVMPWGAGKGGGKGSDWEGERTNSGLVLEKAQSEKKTCL